MWQARNAESQIMGGAAIEDPLARRSEEPSVAETVRRTPTAARLQFHLRLESFRQMYGTFWLYLIQLAVLRIPQRRSGPRQLQPVHVRLRRSFHLHLDSFHEG